MARPKTSEPWTTPAWKAHCVDERQRFRDGLYHQLMAPIMGPAIVDMNGGDKEMWRRVHDPVGARRLNLTRMVQARGLDPTDKYWAAYIQRGCDAEQGPPAVGLGARLDSLTNLKDECKAHGIPASGTKSKLQERLRDYASGAAATGKRRRGE